MIIPNALVLASVGDNTYSDFLNALAYGLEGLIEYFEFIVDMYAMTL